LWIFDINFKRTILDAVFLTDIAGSLIVKVEPSPKIESTDIFPLDLLHGCCCGVRQPNFILNEAKFFGIAVAIAKNFCCSLFSALT